MNPREAVLDSPDQVSEAILECLVHRRMSEGYKLLDSIAGSFARLDARYLSTHRLTGRTALWVDAGYPNVGVLALLLGKYTPDVIRWLPAPARACIWTAFGIRSNHDGDYAAAAKTLQRVLDSDDLDNPDIRIMVKFILSRCWQRDGAYDFALDLAVKAREMALENGRPKMAAVISINVAWLLFQSGEREEPHKLLAEAQDSLAQTDDYISLARIESCSARMCRRAAQYDSACEHLQRAISYCKNRPEQPTQLARSLADLAFEKRLHALFLERQVQRSAQRAKDNSAIERQFLELFSSYSALITQLAKHDAALPHLANHDAVKQFARAAIAAVSRSRAEGELRSIRMKNVKRIEELRTQVREHLTSADALYAATGGRRGMRTIATHRGYLNVDQGELTEATADAARAYSLSASDDKIGMAQAKVLECRIEHEKADEEVDRTLAHSMAQRALQAVSEAADLVRGTKHQRLQGKIALWLGLSHIRIGNIEEARAYHVEAESLLHATRHDYLKPHLSQLKAAVSDVQGAISDLGKLIELVNTGVTRKFLRHEFDKLVIKHLAQQGLSAERIATKLKMGVPDVMELLNELGLL